MRRTSTWCRTHLIALALTLMSACQFPWATEPDFGNIDLCAQKDVVTSIKLQPSELTLAIGETAQLTATLNNGEFILCAPQTFWVSSNANVAWVSKGGVRANAVGKSYISARAGGKADSVLVTVRGSESILILSTLG